MILKEIQQIIKLETRSLLRIENEINGVPEERKAKQDVKVMNIHEIESETIT